VIILVKRNCNLTSTFVQHSCIHLLIIVFIVCFSLIAYEINSLLLVFVCVCVYSFVCFQFKCLCDQLLIIVFICVCGHLFCLFSVIITCMFLSILYITGWICVSSKLGFMVRKFEHGA
jgi:hypothetical protein